MDIATPLLYMAGIFGLVFGGVIFAGAVAAVVEAAHDRRNGVNNNKPESFRFGVEKITNKISQKNLAILVETALAHLPHDPALDLGDLAKPLALSIMFDTQIHPARVAWLVSFVNNLPCVENTAAFGLRAQEFLSLVPENLPIFASQGDVDVALPPQHGLTGDIADMPLDAEAHAKIKAALAALPAAQPAVDVSAAQNNARGAPAAQHPTALTPAPVARQKMPPTPARPAEVLRLAQDLIQHPAPVIQDLAAKLLPNLQILHDAVARCPANDPLCVPLTGDLFPRVGAALFLCAKLQELPLLSAVEQDDLDEAMARLKRLPALLENHLHHIRRSEFQHLLDITRQIEVIDLTFDAPGAMLALPRAAQTQPVA